MPSLFKVSVNLNHESALNAELRIFSSSHRATDILPIICASFFPATFRRNVNRVKDRSHLEACNIMLAIRFVRSFAFEAVDDEKQRTLDYIPGDTGRSDSSVHSHFAFSQTGKVHFFCKLPKLHGRNETKRGREEERANGFDGTRGNIGDLLGWLATRLKYGF